jgi:hypothetical protein
MIRIVCTQSWSEQITMKKSIPAINETADELQQLLHPESDAQTPQRVQALYR